MSYTLGDEMNVSKLVTALAIVLACAIGACSGNAGATAKCKGMHNSSDCNYCCRSNGAGGSLLSSGNCSCLN